LKTGAPQRQAAKIDLKIWALQTVTNTYTQPQSCGKIVTQGLQPARDDSIDGGARH